MAMEEKFSKYLNESNGDLKRAASSLAKNIVKFIDQYDNKIGEKMQSTLKYHKWDEDEAVEAIDNVLLAVENEDGPVKEAMEKLIYQQLQMAMKNIQRRKEMFG